MGVDLSEEELGRASRQEVCRAVPAYVGDCVEVICDSGDGCCDNGVVLSGVSAFLLSVFVYDQGSEVLPVQRGELRELRRR